MAYVAHRSPLYEDLVNDAFINTTGFSLAETGYIGCIVFTKAGLNLNLVAVVSAFLIFSISVGGIMVKLAVKIAKTLRNSSLSGIVAIHQKRIFILLLYQVLNMLPIQKLHLARPPPRVQCLPSGIHHSIRLFPHRYPSDSPDALLLFYRRCSD